jgi:protein SCO1/2
MNKLIYTSFRIILPAIFLLIMAGCGGTDPLPVMGEKTVTVVNGKDTVTEYHVIPAFSFLDQDSNRVTNETYRDKIYIADFFFTTCPTICPKMKAQMVTLHDNLLDDPEVLLLSHTIDPKHDTVAVLHDYADKLGIKTAKWHMVTGEKAKIYEIAKSYFVTALEDNSAPGGFIHSGAFILVDKEGRVRGAYDGTKPETVPVIMKDLKKLKAEYQSN